MTKKYFIGLMSGTSMDGVDAVLVDFNDEFPKLIGHHTEPLPDFIFNGLQRLCQSGIDEINQLGQLDRAVGKLFAKAVNSLLQTNNISAEQVYAIGSHGQTIRHMPNLDLAYSLQIGDPNTIAIETGIDVIADFRKKDIALGGQGAPLVPAFHQHTFAKTGQNRIILNIGGIANITYLPGDADHALGFDTGPGNTLMDGWIQHIKQQPYDDNGKWAESGTTHQALLSQMLEHDYFSMPAPKSTGKELFNNAWLTQHIAEYYDTLSQADIQSTLLDLTCYSIANEIKKLCDSATVYICGGGALNQALINRLTVLLPKHIITTTDTLGIAPKWVEGIAFAWLALRHYQKLPANLPAVTGANKAAILGSYFPAN